jgi:hypothetical protein
MSKVTQRQALTASNTWIAATLLAGIPLPTTGLITEVRIRAAMTATLAATAYTDCTRRAIDGLVVQASSKSFIGLAGNIDLGTLLALQNLADHGITGLGANTDVGATSFNQSYILHPGSYPKQKFDTSVVIPARKMTSQQLQMVINAPAAAVVDSAGSGITAGIYYLEVDSDNDSLISPRMKIPAGLATILHPTQNNASMPGISTQIPYGFWIRRIIIMALDQTSVAPLRSDALISGIQIAKPKTSQVLIEENWEDAKYNTAKRYGILGDVEDTVLGAVATTRPGYNGSLHLPAGFAIIDFRDYVSDFIPQTDANGNPVLNGNGTPMMQYNTLGKLYGVDGRKLGAGDLMLNLTNASYNTSQSFCIYWDLIADMPAEWVETN